MKTLKKLSCICLVLTMILTLTACGSDAYSDYSAAFKKTASVGSLNVLFDLTVQDGSDTMVSTGNMKMNSSNQVYYEMEINGNQIMQYVDNGEVHTFVDGEEQVASISNKDTGTERGNPDGEGQGNEKTDSTGFNSQRFLEEFSGILEAGKIREMGVLDPISSKYIKTISSAKEGSDVVYTMTFPNEFLTTLLNVIIDEQLGSSGSSVEFSNLKDFQCISKENSKGYLYFIEYKGYTTVTVPADLMDSGAEDSFDLYIDLKMDIQNPGTAVDVVIPS